MKRLVFAITLVVAVAGSASVLITTRVRVWVRVPQARVFQARAVSDDSQVYRSNDGELALVLRDPDHDSDGKILVITTDRRVRFADRPVRVGGFLFTGTDDSSLAGRTASADVRSIRVDDLIIDASIDADPIFTISRERNFDRQR